MKNTKKRFIVFIGVFIMMITCMTNATVYAGTSLDSLMNQYVGTRWVDMNGDSLYYYGYECKGFANYIFKELWDVKHIGAYDSSKYYIPNPSGAYEIGRLDFNSMSLDNAKNLLSQGLPGDFIQVRRRGKDYGHSMILVSTNTEGITVFDCNSDGKCTIKKYNISWWQFYNANSAMSLYRANNNKGESESQSTVFNGVDYSSVYNFDYYTLKNPDVKKTFGNDQKAVFEHFLARGMLEGRRGSVEFDVNYYRSQNPDLQRAYGNDLKSYYLHYITQGRLENRKGVETNVNGVDYSFVYSFDYYTANHPDVNQKYGNDRDATFQHFLGRGMLEGRRASAEFDVNYYRSQNPDLQKAYGSDLKSYYLHYITQGRLENRKGAA